MYCFKLKETVWYKECSMKMRFLMLSILLSGWLYAQEPDSAAMGDIEFEPQIEPDVERKAGEIKQLTVNAVRYFLRNSLDISCNDFVRGPLWRKGELFPFVFDQNGTVLAHGDDIHLIWKDISHVKGLAGTSLIKDMLAIPGGKGRISYLWDNGFKTAYIQKVTKGGMTYIIGSGFFPEGDEYTTQQLVKTAVAYFRRHGKTATFALISNPRGPFVRGDVYTFAYDFNGVCVAHGQNPALVGQNLIDQVDSRGKPLIKELIRVARTKGKGWVDYYWRNEFKRAYVERAVDPKTKKPYVLGAGYYPYITLKTVESYVKRAIAYLKSQGSKEAFAEFSNEVGKFARAGLGVFVFDFRGKCLANGQNPGFVGQNLSKLTDAQGKYYVREIIRTARKYGKGLVNYVDANTQAIAYVEAVDLPDGKFVVGATYYPDSKVQSTQTLVNKAVGLLREKDASVAFRSFIEPSGEFIRGDLSIFVYGGKGTRYVNGIHTGDIWRNFIRTTDQTGKPIIGTIIETAVNGGGWVEYKTRNAQRRVYVKAVDKVLEGGELTSLILGSGYFM
jgi:cytochrome c